MQATTVAAQGEAKTDYNLATFSLSLEATRPAVPTAKVLLKKKVDALLASLDEMKKKLNLEFVKNSVQSSSSVHELHEWKNNKNVSLGFQATYSYSFQIDNLDLVSQVYDTLTSLEEVTVNQPHYALKQATRDKLNKKALKHAFEKVTDRFETECKVLGLNPADFEIANWEATYSDSRRSDRVAKGARLAAASYALESASYDDAPVACAATGGGAAHEPLELVVGQATVYANLEVGYARRVTQSVKAEVVKRSTLPLENNTHV